MSFLVWCWYFAEHLCEDSKVSIAAMECRCRQQATLQYLCGILWHLCAAALQWAAVAEIGDLLHPTQTWHVHLLAECCCHCPIAACSCLVSSNPSGSCCCAGSGLGCQRWLQVLRVVMGVWRRNGADCLSLTASPSSLLFPLGVPLFLLWLNCHHWLLWVARGTCKKLKSEKYWKMAVSEG